MIDAMRPGAVVVDLAAERGGNCAVTRADTETVRNGVTVLGPTDLPSRCARHASQMFSRNLTTFLRHLAPEGEPVIDTEDEITAAMLITHRGAVVHPAVTAAAHNDATDTTSEADATDATDATDEADATDATSEADTTRLTDAADRAAVSEADATSEAD